MNREQQPLTIYVCGPRTGIPEENTPAILGAATQLRKLGHTVLTPVDININFLGSPYSLPEQMKAIPGLRADILALVSVCNAIALLPAWEKARGCRLEVAIAIIFGFTFVDWETGEPEPRPKHVTITHGYHEDEPTGPGTHDDACKAMLQLAAAPGIAQATSMSHAMSLLIARARRAPE